MASNTFNDLSNSDILFINILNSIYNDNLRIIHHLMDHNDEIIGTLINIMNNRRRNINPTFNRNRHTSNVNINNTNGYTNQRRMFIDNIPYYLDNMQLFTLPNTTTERNSTNRNTYSNPNLTNQFSRILHSFLEPINVTPSQTQIQNATRNIVYGDILDPINNSCPISLENFTDTSNVTMIRHCRHIFNTSSLMAWFDSNCKCPVCRYDIRDYRVNINNANISTTEEESISDEEIETNTTTNNDANTNNNINTSSRNNNNVNNNVNNTTRFTSQTRGNNNPSLNNILENLFNETYLDLSGNNTDYVIDNASLLTLLYPLNRRRETRR
jgi:hypothetical protein